MIQNSCRFRIFSRALLAAALLTLAVPASAEVSLVSFQTWKTGKVEEARANLEKLQADKGLVSGAAASLNAVKVTKNDSKPATPQQRQQKISQAQANLEIAQELTVSDYFVLYLSQFRENREAFVEAAKKLSPEETADLMMAYQKRLSGASEMEESTTVTQAK